MNTKEQVLLSIKKKQAKKYNFSAVDEISSIIEGMDWDNKLDSVYQTYRDANDFSEGILGNAQNEIQGAIIRMESVITSLNDLGVEPSSQILDLESEVTRISQQVDGLADDISGGVLV